MSHPQPSQPVSTCSAPTSAGADDARRALIGLVGLGSVAALASMASGKGPLNPPPGPVASSGHTLDELLAEVRKRRGAIPISAETTPGLGTSLLCISQPGNYFLPHDFAAPAATLPLLLITADEVDLDLNGRTLMHAAYSPLNPAVLQVGNNSYQPNSVRVHDGIIAGNGTTGVVIGAPGYGLIFENVSFQGAPVTVGAGVFSAGRTSFRECLFVSSAATALDLPAATGVRVERCTFTAFSPMSLGSYARVESCLIVSESPRSDTGIQVGAQSTVTDCQVANYGVNSGSTPGNAAILAGDGCRVERCHVSGSTRSISVGNNCSVSDNTVTSGLNSGTGVYCVGQRNTVQRNVISAQNVGIQCGTVGNNLVMHNAFANVGSGIVATSPGNLIGTFLNTGNQGTQTSPWCNLYVA